jgi:DNA polymerase-1
MINKPVLLVDGDIILHRSAEAFTVSEATDDTGDEWRYVTDVKQAYFRVLDEVSDLIKEHGANPCAIIALSSQPNWRLNVLPPYKGNRKASAKPPGFKELKRRIGASRLTVVGKETLEGDDILGILATEDRGIVDHAGDGPYTRRRDRIVWSPDKDLRGIPCTLIGGNGIPVEITEDEADLFHLMQALSGDVTDGYKGCPGVGMVTAEKILRDLEPSRRWEAVVQRYQQQGLTEDDALVQARVARICRSDDWDWQKREVILWKSK